ncbi:unknown [Clostridium sp. CAG:451]|nr:unknown [Clostridium sp. CAG:451]
MEKKRQLLLTIGLVLVLVLMIVGISYAAFKFTGLGKKENTITTGAITMKYTESTNVINMTGALPTTDKTGKVRLTEGEYFDFTLEGTIKGTENIALQSPRYLTGGYYYKKQGTKQLQKSRYETMYEVIRTYCTSHPVISTRQVENSISEAKNTRCMLLWAYAFFDWRNEHE